LGKGKSQVKPGRDGRVLREFTKEMGKEEKPLGKESTKIGGGGVCGKGNVKR